MTKREYAKEKQAQARAKLDGLVERLTDSRQLGRALQERRFSVAADAPSRKWSFLNQLTMILSDTYDARGFRQWQQVGRHVKKGAEAIQIFAPMTRPKTERDDETGEERVRSVLSGFKLINVFRYEDTEGEPIEGYGEDRDVADLPLAEVAESLGVAVRYAPTRRPVLGVYRPKQNEIVLCSDGEQTFFHELSHAIDARLGNLAHDPNDPTVYAHNEIVAELSACFLASLYGKQADLAGTRAYVAMYAEQKSQHPAHALMSALERVDAIYAYVSEHTHATEGVTQ